MMLPCINKRCKNKSYVPKKIVEKGKLKSIICNSCAMKVQEDYNKLPLKEKKQIEKEVQPIIEKLSK